MSMPWLGCFPADDKELLDRLGVEDQWRVLWIGEEPAITSKMSIEILDIENASVPTWPYEDKEFDFVICRNVLQTVQDPKALCAEMCRVAVRGYVEVPSSFNELLYGNPRNQWICSIDEGGLVFKHKPYIRHPLTHIGRKLYYTEESFRDAYEKKHRELFFIQLQWQDSIHVHVMTGSTDSEEVFDSLNPLHQCVSWLDLALNCMSFNLSELDEDIRHGLYCADITMPGNKIGLAVAELFHNKATSDPQFYGNLVANLRQQNLVQILQKPGNSASDLTEGHEGWHAHYEILKELYKPERSHPLVSVVIRTYNRPDLLERCLQSINHQFYPSIEVIVVNDGGEEISHLLAQSKYPCHYVRHAENRGKAAALNTGLRLVRGKYINILDDDDLLYPDHIALLVHALEHSNYRVAYSDSLMTIQSQILGEWHNVSKKLVYSVQHDRQLLLRTNYLPVLSVLFEASLLNECGYVDERFEVLEDWDLWIRFAQETDFYHVKQITSEYTQRADGDNATQESAALFDINRKRIAQKYHELYTNEPVPPMTVMPKRYRSRLLSIWLESDSIDTIREAIQTFIRDFSELPWSELTIVHRCQQLELDSLRRELSLLDSHTVHFVSFHEIEDKEEFFVQFDSEYSVTLAGDVKQNSFFGPLYRMEKKEPLVSLIVLAKNQLAYTKLCVESIYRHTRVPFELILVDNGSTDGTRAYFKDLALIHNNIKLVLNVDNKGYGGGNNQGLACSTGDFVILLNNDVIVTRDWVQGMLNAQQSHPKCGIVGPVSNYVPAPQLIQDPLYSVEHLDTYAAYYRKAHAGRTLVVNRVIGFCMLIKREVVDTIGGFDLRYEIGNFEDDDLCIRALLAGYECIVAQEVFIHHFGSTTFKNDSNFDYERIYHTNFAKFVDKWNIVLKEDGVYEGWTRSDIPVKEFLTAEHYSPIAADRTITSLLEKANELFQLKKVEECEAVLLQCRAVHGDQPVILYNLLVHYMQNKNLQKAAWCFTFLDEMMVDVGYLKIIWLVWAGQHKDAAVLLHRLFDKYPDQPQLLSAQNYIKVKSVQ
ncbi:glycosyltransferase [Paenibacillus timonensis]|uniref:glycosyltransferase n=1 Tax=Paenibacillus timonensis TaxID=225915 RepID=UPI0022E12484|nr:glycosyltransferase [Paenibacillus timonensis]